MSELDSELDKPHPIKIIQAALRAWPEMIARLSANTAAAGDGSAASSPAQTFLEEVRPYLAEADEAINRAIKRVGGNPRDNMWDEIDIRFIIELAEAADIAADYGFTLVLTPPRKRKKGGGRPAALTRKEVRWAKKELEKGDRTQKMLAAQLDVDPRTLSRHLDKLPDEP